MRERGKRPVCRVRYLYPGTASCEKRFCFGELILLAERVSQAVQRIDVIGIQRQGRAVAGDCGGIVALQAVGVAEIVVKVRRVRIRLNGVADSLNCGLVLTLLLGDHSQ